MRRGYINGSSATAVQYLTSSDRRLKKDIEVLPSQIDNIKKLNAKKYKWIETNEDDIGFIFQEVIEIFPFMDDRHDDTNYHGLDYGKFTPYLWSGVKELIDRVEKLEIDFSKIYGKTNKDGVVGETLVSLQVESNPNVYLLKDVIQQQKDMKTQLSIQDDKINSMVGQLIINHQQEKINYLENMILSLQKQLNMINNVLISKNIL